MERVVQRAALEAAVLARREFLANVSHEIRTPLTAILGFADLLLEDGDLDAAGMTRADAVEVIKRNGARLLEIVDKCLELSDLELGLKKPTLAPFSPSALVEEIGAVVACDAQQKGLEFRAACASDLPASVVSDRGSLRQILVHLIRNAIRFTDSGGVNLRADYLDSPAQIHFEVRDSGTGLSPHQIAVLYQPFFRHSEDQEHAGTGLGLSITRCLTEQLGGSIDVETEAGRGTVFRVVLPVGERRKPRSSGRVPRLRELASS